MTKLRLTLASMQSVLLSAGSNAGGGGAGGSGNNPFDDTTFLVIWVIGVSLIIMVVVVAIVLVLVGWFFPPARDIIRPKRSNKHIKRLVVIVLTCQNDLRFRSDALSTLRPDQGTQRGP